MTRVHTSQGWRSESLSVTAGDWDVVMDAGASVTMTGLFIVVFVSRSSFLGSVRARELGDLPVKDLLVASRAEGVLSGDVAVLGADGEGGCYRDVGEREALEGAPNELQAGGRVGGALGNVEVEHGPARGLSLQVVLVLKG